ncbi:hypothetical protein [Sutcliffiella horikoshii]|uniref:hypothetical protein n=1 Tax=Sutcliffiella horikoshii TaxID=79883 RepID=UPI00384FF68D
MYKFIRTMFKHLYLLLQIIIPQKLFIAISFRVMYLANKQVVSKYRKKYNVKLLGEMGGKLKKSNTLFILGSGSSVNSLTNEQWEEIKKHDSVGFNFWFLHDFTPSFYVYEENLNTERNDIFYDILSTKKEDYKDIPFIVKDIEYKGLTYEKIPEELRDQFYLSTDITFQSQKNDLQLFYKLGYEFIRQLNKDIEIKVLLKKSGTLSYLLTLGEQLGYKKIVLCGVDLNNSKYFYDSTLYKEKFKIPAIPINSMEKHPTNQALNGNIPMEEIISVIDQTILVPKGIKLYIGSKTSALYPKLPYYFDEQEESEVN